MMEPLHWDLIVTALRSRRCVPFLGAAVNVSTTEYQGLPLGREVAIRLLERLLDAEVPDVKKLVRVARGPMREQYEDLAVARLQDLARVALHVEVTGDKEHLMDLLEAIIPDDQCQPSRLLQTLARLPLDLIVTTNYDRLMEKALEQSGQAAPLVVGPPVAAFGSREQVREQEFLKQRLSSHSGLVLYKIHGTFGDQVVPRLPDGRRSPIIISEEDYIEFLTVAPLQDVGVPNLISAKLENSVLLFLGYGLEDWDFRTIHKVLIDKLRRNDKRKSFAIQRKPSKFWVNYWAEKKVVIYDMDLYDFAAELERRYFADPRT
jgi:SIR2-like domain